MLRRLIPEAMRWRRTALVALLSKAMKTQSRARSPVSAHRVRSTAASSFSSETSGLTRMSRWSRAARGRKPASGASMTTVARLLGGEAATASASAGAEAWSPTSSILSPGEGRR